MTPSDNSSDHTSAQAASLAEASEVSTSESEEMYLITIAMAGEDGHEGPVPVPQLAERLSVSRVSANEMVKKLAARGLLEYVRYKGALLTPPGEEIARQVLRRRRLWAVFLSEHLGFSAGAADAVACELEHTTPAEVAHQLSEFLGDPRVGPGGKPIPPSAEASPDLQPLPLRGMQVGDRSHVVQIHGDSAVRSFLTAEGITIGSPIELMGLAEDGGCLVAGPRGRVHLSSWLADQIGVASAG